VEQALEVLR